MWVNVAIVHRDVEELGVQPLDVSQGAMQSGWMS